jgi:NAD dependent epimerase/dehydratase family enzyme
MSWVSLVDHINVINLALENEGVRGAVNSASPSPVTNEEFTKTMGEVLYRPTFIPVPEFAVHMLMGEMGEALLLDSTRVVPKRLTDLRFKFKFADLKKAIENAVK